MEHGSQRLQNEDTVRFEQGPTQWTQDTDTVDGARKLGAESPSLSFDTAFDEVMSCPVRFNANLHLLPSTSHGLVPCSGKHCRDCEAGPSDAEMPSPLLQRSAVTFAPLRGSRADRPEHARQPNRHLPLLPLLLSSVLTWILLLPQSLWCNWCFVSVSFRCWRAVLCVYIVDGEAKWDVLDVPMSVLLPSRFVKDVASHIVKFGSVTSNQALRGMVRVLSMCNKHVAPAVPSGF